MADLNSTLWIIGIVAFFAMCVWLIIRVAFQLERQDQRRGRRDLDEGGSFVDPNDGLP